MSELLTDQSKLTEKQKDVLVKFRDRLKDVLKPEHDDPYLLRWLIAREFDLKKSEKMLRDHLTWRVQVNADDMLEWKTPEVLTKYYPGDICGYDKVGRPVWIELPGYADFRGVLYSVKKSDIIKMKIRVCETLQNEFKKQTQKLGHPVHGSVIIVDLEKFGFKQLWKPALDLTRDLLKLFEANYPETLVKVYAVNGPKIFSVLYSMCKPFLSEATKKKIHVLGGNWKSRLLEDIDADQLPVNWGGTQTGPDGDPLCKLKLHIGGEVPEECYMTKSDVADQDALTTVNVSRNSKYQFLCMVTEPGTVLRWQFFTEDHDIGFGIRRKLGDGSYVTVLPNQRVNSHIVPEDGSVICGEPGKYVAEFDNTHKFLSSNTLWFSVETHPPTTTENVSKSESPVNSNSPS